MSEKKIVLRRPAAGAAKSSSASASSPAIPYVFPDESAAFVIVGGGYASISTAVQLQRAMRSAQKEARIIMFSQEEFCSKPAVFFRLKFPEKEKIEYGRVDEAYYQKHGITLRNQRVAFIDKDKQLVITESGEEIKYHKLVLATGGRPYIPSYRFLYDNTTRDHLFDFSGAQKLSNFVSNLFPGESVEDRLVGLSVVEDEATHKGRWPSGLFPIRNPVESILLHQLLMDKKRVVIVGGGTLCLDILNSLFDGKMLQSLRATDEKAQIIVLFRRKELGAPLLDKVGSAIVTSCLAKCVNVQLLPEDEIDHILVTRSAIPQVTGIVTLKQNRVSCDAIVLATGVQSDIDLAKKSLIATNRGILVDSRYETSSPNIFAVGDCAEIKDPLKTSAGVEEKTSVYKNWNSAADQGKACATALLTDKSYNPEISIFYQNFRCFGLHVTSIGVSDMNDKIDALPESIRIVSGRFPLPASSFVDISEDQLYTEQDDPACAKISGYIRLILMNIGVDFDKYKIIGALVVSNEPKLGTTTHKFTQLQRPLSNVPIQSLVHHTFNWDELIHITRT